MAPYKSLWSYYGHLLLLLLSLLLLLILMHHYRLTFYEKRRLYDLRNDDGDDKGC